MHNPVDETYTNDLISTNELCLSTNFTIHATVDLDSDMTMHWICTEFGAIHMLSL